MQVPCSAGTLLCCWHAGSSDASAHISGAAARACTECAKRTGVQNLGPCTPDSQMCSGCSCHPCRPVLAGQKHVRLVTVFLLSGVLLHGGPPFRKGRLTVAVILAGTLNQCAACPALTSKRFWRQRDTRNAGSSGRCRTHSLLARTACATAAQLPNMVMFHQFLSHSTCCSWFSRHGPPCAGGGDSPLSSADSAAG